MNDLKVYKSNALVEAQYRLSVAEQRIMLACIAQIKRDQFVTDDVLYSVSAVDIATISNTSTKQAYRELEKAALRLKRREVRLIQEPNGKASRRKVIIAGWVQTIFYIEEEGRIELRFNKDMLPYLTQLTEQFTRYALNDVARMTSAHAIRLYELLCQWQTTGKREVSLDWLRSVFQLDNKYPAIKDLKRWVIEPAVKQINEHSPLWVKWSQRKTGRQVTHLVFTFGQKNKEKSETKSIAKAKKADQTPLSSALPKGPSMFGISPEVIQEYALEGDSWSIAAARARAALK